MRNKPLFSIVIPTRNKADLLYYTLKNAMNLKYDDYEIIVSNNASTDKTEDIVMKLANSKVKYIKTDNVFNQAEHFEFATNLASGEYISILSDDDAYHPDILHKLEYIVKEYTPYLITYPFVQYISNDWLEGKNSLFLPRFSNTIRKIVSKNQISYLIHNYRFSLLTPCLIRSFYHRNIISKIKSEIGSLFFMPHPDYGAHIIFCLLTDNFIFFDEPLYIFSYNRKSFGLSLLYTRENNCQYINNITMLEYAPLKLQLFTVYNFETLLRIQEKVKRSLVFFHNNAMDLIRFFVECYKDLTILKKRNIDVSRDLEVFYTKIKTLPQSHRERIHNMIQVVEEETLDKNNKSIAIKKILLKVIDSLSLLRRIEDCVRKQLNINIREKHHNYWVKINGSDEGFTNILECSQKLPYILNKHRELRCYI